MSRWLCTSASPHFGPLFFFSKFIVHWFFPKKGKKVFVTSVSCKRKSKFLICFFCYYYRSQGWHTVIQVVPFWHWDPMPSIYCGGGHGVTIIRVSRYKFSIFALIRLQIVQIDDYTTFIFNLIFFFFNSILKWGLWLCNFYCLGNNQGYPTVSATDFGHSNDQWSYWC